MKRSLAILALLLPATLMTRVSAAQSTPEPWQNILSALKPRSVGPVNMGGRVTDIAVYEKEPRIFYVASASGGIWKTINGGTTFIPEFQNETSISMGAVAVSHNSPDVVWAGTGEGTSRNSVAWGDGVYKSVDGGKTWKNMGLAETMHINRIVIDPKDDNTVYVGALGRLWGPNPERGLYKTTDGGKTWALVLKVDENTGVGDIILDPAHPKTLIVAMWQRLRKAYDFTSGGPGSGLYKSTDGGKTWKKLAKGIPAGPLGRIGLNYFHKDSKTVVATIEYPKAKSVFDSGETDEEFDADDPRAQGQDSLKESQQRRQAPAATPGQSGNGVAFNNGGTFISKDGGESWKQVNNLNPRPFYFSLPRFDTADAKRIYLGATDLHVSDDGGAIFRTSRINVHADIHALWIDPNDANHLIIGCDGGVYQSRDHAATWEHLNKLAIGQFYSVAFDFRKPFWIYGGLQDNGSWGIPTQTSYGGPGFWNADNVGGGDGFHVQVDPNDWSTVYAESQGGFLQRRDMKTGGGRSIIPTPPNGQPRYRFNWSTPFILSPHNSKTLYMGSNKLLKSVNRGDSWKEISPDLSTNDPEKQKAGKNSVTPEDTGAERHCTIITISESPVRQGLIYVGTDDGLVWVTQDDGAKWTNITANFPELPANTWCSRVAASRFVEGRVYATFDGHRANDFKSYVYASEDFGKTWTKINAGLPDYDCVYVITEGQLNPDLLYLGSEKSLRFSLDRGKTWSKLHDTFPTVAVHDLKVHPRDLDLVVGTHGRSIWTINVTALEQLTPEKLGTDVVALKPHNVLILNQVRDAPWDGDQVVISRNNQPGTQIQYYLKADDANGAKIVISSVDGATTTELKGASKAGLNSVDWNGRLRNRIVEPGEYRVTITIGGKDYITTVTVDAAD